MRPICQLHRCFLLLLFAFLLLLFTFLFTGGAAVGERGGGLRTTERRACAEPRPTGHESLHCCRGRVVKKVGFAGGDEGDVGAATRLCVAQFLATVVLDLHRECPPQRPELVLSLDPKLLGHGPLLLIISLPAAAPGILLLHEGNVPRDGIFICFLLVLVVIRFLKKRGPRLRLRLRLGLGSSMVVVEVDGLDEAAEGVVGLASGGGDVVEPGREAREVGLGGDGPSEREEVVLDLGPKLVVPAAEEGEQGRAVVGE
ncbi:hypothetical protein [Oryza sativa Japonica Group]|uniref:Uncharacterized protein n=3 Tax=Oryza TaxID=4527 RepID=Q5VRB5_ORYSJ|nr:hypothetical protein [Oryza sativa Japonica Group]BAD68177.1 hypothetical protein [Oryza sativa Japonica Group]